MLSTKLLDFEQREAVYNKQTKQAKKPKTKDVEMCEVDPENITATKITRLQSYLNVLDAKCQNPEKDQDPEKKKAIKMICIDVFNQIENEHKEEIAKNYSLVKSCKTELFHIVNRIIEHFEKAPNTFEDYIFLFKLVKESAVLKMHTNEYYRFWPMNFTQTQINTLESIRQIALYTLQLSIKEEHDKGYRSKDRRIIPSLNRALTLDLFMLPLGNKIATNCEKELRAMLVNAEEKLGMRRPSPMMNGY